MGTRLIIDGNSVYEIDEDCIECRKQRIRHEYKDDDMEKSKKDRITSQLKQNVK